MRLKYNPIIVAIDTTDVIKADRLKNLLRGHIGATKLGLEFFTAHGRDKIKSGERTLPLFLDLKFHDIPNTVAGAVRATKGIDAFMMTVHAAGGEAMMRAANDAAREITPPGEKKPLIVAVTVLTSLDDSDIKKIGAKGKVSDQVKRLAELAQKSGVDGVVCSPHEIEVLCKQCGKGFNLVVPGIRPIGSEKGDQKRVMTPKEAMDAGASYLVIGRPITEAPDPAKAAEDILKSL